MRFRLAAPTTRLRNHSSSGDVVCWNSIIQQSFSPGPLSCDEPRPPHRPILRERLSTEGHIAQLGKGDGLAREIHLVQPTFASVAYLQSWPGGETADCPNRKEKCQ